MILRISEENQHNLNFSGVNLRFTHEKLACDFVRLRF